MNDVSPMKHGFVDLAAVLFVIGGNMTPVLTLLGIPITSLYPINIPTSFSTVFVVVLAISLIYSLGAIKKRPLLYSRYKMVAFRGWHERNNLRNVITSVEFGTDCNLRHGCHSESLR
jgi:Ca2+/Na+ antiporter